LRFHPHAVLLVVVLALAGPAALADEVELHSGTVFTGTVEKETETEVVLRTDLGAMTIRKSRIKEIRRTGGGNGPATPGAPAAPPAAKAFSLDGVNPAVLPVVAGKTVFAVMKDGRVGAYAIPDGRRRWRSDVGRGKITGLAADSGALYLVTNDGHAARLNPSTGQVVWIANAGGAFAGAPLVFRRGLFAFQPNGGIVGIETADGKVRGRLGLPVVLDTPLGAAGDSIVFGTTGGLLMSVGEDGKKLGGAFETGTRWRGRGLASWLRTVTVASKEKIVSFETDRQKVTKRVPVAGLTSHPFAADATRVYVELAGALAALNIVNGRIAWRSYDVPRVLAMTVEARRLFVTTADDTVAAVSRMDGRLLWESPLGGRAASPPIPGGGTVLVALRDGRLRSYSGTDSPVPEPGREPPRPPAPVARTLHSPDGYSLTVPAGWSPSENATAGAVSLGFRPDAGSPRFDLESATERDLRLLEVTTYLAVLVTPAPDTSIEAQAKRYLSEEKAAAAQGEYGIESAAIDNVKLGSKQWTRVSLEQVVARDMLKGTFRKVALVRPLSGGQNVWVELKVPTRFMKIGIEDLTALATSLRPEKAADFTPSAEVAVAEAAVAALNRGDLEAFLPLLAEPLRRPVSEGKFEVAGRRIRLVTRMSMARGSRREVRLRIDTRSGTDFTGLTLSREAGRWVIIHLGGLMK